MPGLPSPTGRPPSSRLEPRRPADASAERRTQGGGTIPQSGQAPVSTTCPRSAPRHRPGRSRPGPLRPPIRTMRSRATRRRRSHSALPGADGSACRPPTAALSLPALESLQSGGGSSSRRAVSRSNRRRLAARVPASAARRSRRASRSSASSRFRARSSCAASSPRSRGELDGRRASSAVRSGLDDPLSCGNASLSDERESRSPRASSARPGGPSPADSVSSIRRRASRRWLWSRTCRGSRGPAAARRRRVGSGSEREPSTRSGNPRWRAPSVFWKCRRAVDLRSFGTVRSSPKLTNGLILAAAADRRTESFWACG